MPTAMMTVCVTMKVTKMGINAVTDSLTPRRLSSTSTATAVSSTCSLSGRPAICSCAQWPPLGSTLKRASPPAAIDTEMVST